MRNFEPTHGMHSRTRKLDAAQVIEIRRLAAAGIARRDISKQFKVTESCVGRVIRGEVWSKAT